MNEKSCRDIKVFPLVAEKMAKFHLQLTSYQQLFEDGELEYLLWGKIKLFLASYNVENSEEDKSRHQQRYSIHIYV